MGEGAGAGVAPGAGVGVGSGTWPGAGMTGSPSMCGQAALSADEAEMVRRVAAGCSRAMTLRLLTLDCGGHFWFVPVMHWARVEVGRARRALRMSCTR